MAFGLKTKGGNKTLNPHAREEWMKGKKIDRKKPAQVWVWDIPTMINGVMQQTGHWERRAA